MMGSIKISMPWCFGVEGIALKLVLVVRTKVTTPNYDFFLKSTSLDSWLKCTSTIYESSRLLTLSPYFYILKIHMLFTWCPKNVFQKNLESPFDYQFNETPLKNFNIVIETMLNCFFVWFYG